MPRHECDVCPRTFRTAAKLEAHREQEAARPRTPRHRTVRQAPMPVQIPPSILAAMMAAAKARDVAPPALASEEAPHGS